MTVNKLTTYLIGAIENDTIEEMSSWRNTVSELLKKENIYIYDPVEFEINKTNVPIEEHINKLKNLKNSRNTKKFMKQMWSIWMNGIPFNHNLLEIIKNIQLDKMTHGNNFDTLHEVGDFEITARSDFVICYFPKNTKTIGTIYEIMTAFLLNIPIYLIIPDGGTEDLNCSLYFGILLSQGRIFKDINGCVKYIKRKWL